MEVQADLGSS